MRSIFLINIEDGSKCGIIVLPFAREATAAVDRGWTVEPADADICRSRTTTVSQPQQTHLDPHCEMPFPTRKAAVDWWNLSIDDITYHSL